MTCLIIGSIVAILVAVGIVAMAITLHLRWIDTVIERAVLEMP